MEEDEWRAKVERSSCETDGGRGSAKSQLILMASEEENASNVIIK